MSELVYSGGRVSCRLLGRVLLAAVIVSGCAHHPNPSAELTSGLAPFTAARTQALHLIATTKGSLAPADINTLAVTYTALEEKANAYASFMADSIRSSSFDAAQNSECASQLTAAINKFNKALPAIVPAKDARPISAAWVPTFADSIQARWASYSASASTMSHDAKEALLKQLRAQTLWPNYEDIATESI